MTGTLPNHITYWLSEAKHDCFFLVGSEVGSTERIGAIKGILLGYSDPLRAMLQDSELAEPDDICLIDVEPETFRNFLKCVYGGSNFVIPKLSFEEAAKLLYVTEKYLVEHLKAEITTHLCNIWSPDKILLAFCHPVCFNIKTVEKKLCEVLQKGFIEITSDEEFLNASCTTITWILQQQKLNVKEVEIWKAILKWSEHQVKSNGETLRSYIFPFLKYIRFLAMDCEDFCGNVVPSGILLQEEIKEIMLSYRTKNIPSTEHLCKTKKHRYETRVNEESDNIITTSSWEIPNAVFINYTVKNISNLDLMEYSEPVTFAGFCWQLELKKHPSEDGNWLSIYIGFSNFIKGWPNTVKHTCKAKITYTLLNQAGKGDVQRHASHEFSCQEYDWGYHHFSEWSKVLDPANGLVKDNTILVMIRIQLND